MFDIEVSDVIILIIIILTVIFGVFISMRGVKRTFEKNQTHIVKGWSKKRRGILRTDNDELKRANWKVDFWNILLLLSIIMPVGVIGFSLISRDLSRPIVVSMLVLGIPTAICAAFMWRKRRMEFNKLKNALEIELEYDDDEVEKVISEITKSIYATKMLGIPFVFIYAVTILVLAIMTVTVIVNGNLSIATVITAIIVVGNIPSLINALRFYITDKRQSKKE
ncbi:MAG: hypothetical protein FWB80_10600 [Defluviitaleaceae bacterium]|nr:hypothetical protein [Defluviitaleaceae bacterium]